MKTDSSAHGRLCVVSVKKTYPQFNPIYQIFARNLKKSAENN
jgi:hypothetical protein